MRIWVVVPDYGYEGYGTPETAFTPLAAAEARAKAQKRHIGGDWEIAEIELESDKP